MSLNFEDWCQNVINLAVLHGETIEDTESLKEKYEDGLTAEQAFYDRYPKHNDL